MNQLIKFKTILLTAVQALDEVKVVLARALIFPLLLYIPLSTIEFPEDNLYIYFILLAAYLFVGVLVAIPVHRMILLGPNSVSKWGFNKWSQREITFSCYLFGITFMGLTIVLILGMPALHNINDESYWSEIVYELLFIIFYMIWARFALVFPATAIDDEPSLKKSWHLTKSNQILTFLVVAFYPLAASPLYYFLPDNPFISFITDLGYIFIEVLTIATLSTAYKFIMDEKAKAFSGS